MAKKNQNNKTMKDLLLAVGIVLIIILAVNFIGSEDKGPQLEPGQKEEVIKDGGLLNWSNILNFLK